MLSPCRRRLSRRQSGICLGTPHFTRNGYVLTRSKAHRISSSFRLGLPIGGWLLSKLLWLGHLVLYSLVLILASYTRPSMGRMRAQSV